MLAVLGTLFFRLNVVSAAAMCRAEPQPEVAPETEHPAGDELRSYLQDGEGAPFAASAKACHRCYRPLACTSV